ncbi:hypothetical protein M0R45_004982 [Rubus argutus]|uniref:DEAH11/12 KH-domain domain-containing protein n=1 Tax=Rubus argutus TaxID=59490 RepID=A0AAW1YLF2_RUBAR
MVKQKLVESLITSTKARCLRSAFRVTLYPPELMKEVVSRFGPDLQGLKEKVPGADFSLNVRRQSILINGSKELKQKVEEIIDEIAHMAVRLAAIKIKIAFHYAAHMRDCRSPLLITNLRSLLSNEKLEELFRASLGSYVASSSGTYRFCPSPDCSSVYQIAAPGTEGEPFVCGACYAET